MGCNKVRTKEERDCCGCPNLVVFTQHRHMLGLYFGRTGAGSWKRFLGTNNQAQGSYNVHDIREAVRNLMQHETAIQGLASIKDSPVA